MTFTDIDRRRPGSKYLGRILLAVGLVLVMGLAFVFHHFASRHAQPPGQASLPPSTASAVSPAPSSGGSVLILPRPTGVRNGILVGFPHTTEGAIAATAFDIEAFDSLDVGAAENWARTLAAPGDSAALVSQATKGVAVIRSAAGLPSAGPAYGSYVSYLPHAYQIAEVTPDRLVVWVLATESASSNGSSSTVQPVSLGFFVVWAEGDWHLSADDPGTPPAADHSGTAAATADGWRGLAEAP